MTRDPRHDVRGHGIEALGERLQAMADDLRAQGCDVSVSTIMTPGSVYIANLTGLSAAFGSDGFRIYCAPGDEALVRASLARIVDPAR